MQFYSWKNLSVSILGRKIATLQDVKYKLKVSQEYIWGAGDEPLDIQTSNREVEGSLTILQAELLLLETAAKAANTTIPNLQFDITVVYESKGIVTTDIIMGCKISEIERSFKQNDPVMKVELPFKAIRMKNS
jgi:hypothetical protein